MKKHTRKSTKLKRKENKKGGAKAPSLLFRPKDIIYKIIGIITLLLLFLIGLYLIHQDLKQDSSFIKIVNVERIDTHGKTRR